MNRFAATMVVGFAVFLALSMAVFTFQKCGAYTFLLGKGAGMAAMTGVCDKLNEE